MMDIDALLDPFERLLAEHLDGDLSGAVEAAGYFELLLPEAQGGAGLTLAEAEPLLRALGRHAAPAGIATGMLTRARGNAEVPLELAAVAASVQIAGAGETLLDMTIAYANQRVQFGKPIARQQAIQHQLAIMSEQVVLARIAGQLGCEAGLEPTIRQAGVAKQIASAAVPVIAGVAHAVHGAIGITSEFSLHRYVRHLHDLRMACGSETYWAHALGRVRLDAGAKPSLDFILEA
jgi:acyl-CoA dehydrogenase